MIRRLLWFGLAAAAGIVVYRKVSRTARAYTPAGFAESAEKTAVGFLDSVREFMADVREGMAEREAEIHAVLAENAEYGTAPEWPGGKDSLANDLGSDPDLAQFLDEIGQRHQREGDTD